MGEASYVVIPSLLSDHYPPERRARVLGVSYAAIPVGTALGYVVGGLGLVLLAARGSLEADMPRGEQAPAGPVGSVHL